MKADELLAFAARLPPDVTEVDWITGFGTERIVIKRSPPAIVKAAPEIGDVEKAAQKRAEQKPSDVSSLAAVPPAFKDE